MIDREKIVAVCDEPFLDQAEEIISVSMLKELCRVYLAVIDAREAVVGPDPDTGRDDGAIWTPPEMIGKRVRLVVVEDE